MTIPDDLIDCLSPKGIWYYMRLRQFLDVGQRGKISFKRLAVNRVTGTKNNFLLEKFGFIRVEQGRGYNQANIYTILR